MLKRWHHDYSHAPPRPFSPVTSRRVACRISLGSNSAKLSARQKPGRPERRACVRCRVRLCMRASAATCGCACVRSLRRAAVRACDYCRVRLCVPARPSCADATWRRREGRGGLHLHQGLRAAARENDCHAHDALRMAFPPEVEVGARARMDAHRARVHARVVRQRLPACQRDRATQNTRPVASGAQRQRPAHGGGGGGGCLTMAMAGSVSAGWTGRSASQSVTLAEAPASVGAAVLVLRHSVCVLFATCTHRTESRGACDADRARLRAQRRAPSVRVCGRALRMRACVAQACVRMRARVRACVRACVCVRAGVRAR
jgi:hypothetical protein